MSIRLGHAELARVTCAAAVLFAATSSARAQDNSPPVDAFACYQVVLGKWEPTLELREDSIFVIPPMRIELKRELGSSAFEKHGWLVRPAPGVPASVHRFSYFRLVGDSLSLVWTTGFSGLTMKVAIASDTMHGQAHSFWDFDRRKQTAVVRLVRNSCAPRPNEEL
jgi:hypothetical protein